MLNRICNLGAVTWKKSRIFEFSAISRSYHNPSSALALISYPGLRFKSADVSGNKSADMDRNKCLFCNIVDEKSPDLTQLVYKDEELAVFPDIRPAAKYHFLVVTVAHINDSKCLKHDQVSLVNRMVELGRKIVLEKYAAEREATGSGSAPTLDFRFGFHWPPFHTVAHLHLHVIAPVESMGFISRIVFKPNSWWFVTPEYVKSRLQLQASEAGNSSNSSPPL